MDISDDQHTYMEGRNHLIFILPSFVLLPGHDTVGVFKCISAIPERHGLLFDCELSIIPPVPLSNQSLINNPADVASN